MRRPFVFVVMVCYDYEGGILHGVYPTLKAAQKNTPNRGDYQEIYRVILGTNNTKEMCSGKLVKRG